ncbi:MAG: ATP-binding protein [Stappiaceae bacterium]
MSALPGAEPGDISAIEVAAISAIAGVMSFAVFSAFLLMRSRNKAEKLEFFHRENNADLRTRIDRLEAMLETDDQRLIVWDGSPEEPIILGNLPEQSGAPRDSANMLAFGTWLTPQSAGEMDGGILSLRQHGAPFSVTLKTRSGTYLEASARTAGGWAVVRLRDLTGERQAHAQLEETHNRLLEKNAILTHLLDAMSGPAWLRDREGKLAWVNDAYVRAVEASTAADVVDKNMEFLDSSARGGMEGQRDADGLFTKRLPVVAGESRRIFDIYDASTETGSAGAAIDVSDLEQVQAELRRIVDFHARTLDQLATAVAIFGADRRLQFHNAAFAALWDLDDVFLEGRPEDGAVLDELRAQRKLPEQADYRKWRNKLLESYRSLEAQEFWWHLPDGRTLRVIANPHPQGGVTYIYENVTEQLDLESRFNALTRVQGETLDHLTEAVAVFGSDGKLRLWNPAFADIWRQAPENLDASPHISAIAGQAKGPTEAKLWSRLVMAVTSLADNRTNASGRLERQDGRVIDYATVPLPDGGTLITFVNVTDTVNVERALIEKNEALQEADQLKNTFIQHVSYELRSPLTNIIGFAQLLSDPKFGPLTEKQSEYTDYIMSSSSALLAIINDILDLATIDAGIMELDLGQVDIQETVVAAVEGIKDRLAESNMALRTQVPDGIGTLVADERRVRQVLYNLISNAIRFSDEGGVVEVTCSRGDEDVRFSVRDHGCGISQAMMAEVFDRFVGQGHGAKRRGAGLGLAIVKSFVELHGGRVEIQSKEGQGTEISVAFPIHAKVDGRQAAE